MTTITWTEKNEPVFNESYNGYDYITGYNSIEKKSITLNDDKVDEFLHSLAPVQPFDLTITHIN